MSSFILLFLIPRLQDIGDLATQPNPLRFPSLFAISQSCARHSQKRSERILGSAATSFLERNVAAYVLDRRWVEARDRQRSGPYLRRHAAILRNIRSASAD